MVVYWWCWCFLVVYCCFGYRLSHVPFSLNALSTMLDFVVFPLFSVCVSLGCCGGCGVSLAFFSSSCFYFLFVGACGLGWGFVGMLFWGWCVLCLGVFCLFFLNIGGG